jgi:hypothetical protein
VATYEGFLTFTINLHFHKIKSVIDSHILYSLLPEIFIYIYRLKYGVNDYVFVRIVLALVLGSW